MVKHGPYRDEASAKNDAAHYRHLGYQVTVKRAKNLNIGWREYWLYVYRKK